MKGSRYDKKCGLFDPINRAHGVMFPYFPLSLGQGADAASTIDLDGSASAVFARINLPFTAYLLTCQAFAVSDAQGLKIGAASAEPVIGIVYGTDGLASIDAGTSIGVISCTGAGPIGKTWAGTTTPTVIEPTDEIIVHLKTAAASATSNLQDGGAVPVLWFAQLNSPA